MPRCSALPSGEGTGSLLGVSAVRIKHVVLHGGKILQNDRPKEKAFL